MTCSRATEERHACHVQKRQAALPALGALLGCPPYRHSQAKVIIKFLDTRLGLLPRRTAKCEKQDTWP